MQVAVSAAKGRLTDLVRRAEAGEEIVLTRHGRAVAGIRPIRRHKEQTVEQRLAAIDAIMEEAARRRVEGGPTVREIQNQLHDDLGLPD
ncbi:MAG: type II toxin-antitoxin system prevent-host-death family antitoxin [Sphingomonadaceae bacterium]|nr:type II toxin-antitoxin system prevent-host-death family antitoxin [Sphingomonadaceae bacterium]